MAVVATAAVVVTGAVVPGPVVPGTAVPVGSGAVVVLMGSAGSPNLPLPNFKPPVKSSAGLSHGEE